MALAPRADDLQTFAARLCVGSRGVTADAAGEDRSISVDEALEERGDSDDHLVWVDITGPIEDLQVFMERIGMAVPEEANRGRPRVDDLGGAFLVRVLMPPLDGEGARDLCCVVRKDLVVTQHETELDELGEFTSRSRYGREGRLGALSGPSFLASVLDWHVNAWFRVLEHEEERVDALESRLLSRDASERETDEHAVEQLSALRRRAAVLRRLLAPHREVFARLASPEFDVLTGTEASSSFSLLHDRIRDALDAAENLRELVVGSFEIVMARTSQRTNDVMRILTVTSVAFLPATLLAGVLGMNFSPSFFATAWLFWVALAAIAVLVAGALVIAKRNDWL
jgi:magnesium transporter